MARRCGSSASKEDLPLNIGDFLRAQARPIHLPPEAWAILAEYDWPGNVRELCNALERALSLMPADATALTPERLGISSVGAAARLPWPKVGEAEFVRRATRSCARGSETTSCSCSSAAATTWRAPRARTACTASICTGSFASTALRGNVSAWRIETARLRRRGWHAWSWRNTFLRGHLMSVALVAAAAIAGGWRAALFFVACALWGKALLEIVNYMEHYGMVRNPATPVQPRHSWNTNRRISSWAMFNLTRHSHHHAEGEVPYHALRPLPNAPMMVAGYLTTIVLALVPPLWHALMTPRLRAWDRDFATDEERRLAARANRVSGLRALERIRR